MDYNLFQCVNIKCKCFDVFDRRPIRYDLDTELYFIDMCREMPTSQVGSFVLLKHCDRVMGSYCYFMNLNEL